jgi:hypothetical protein
MEIVLTAGIAVDVVGVLAAVVVIEDAAGAVEGPVAAGAIEDVAALAGEDTRASLPRICTDQHGYRKATARVVAFSGSFPALNIRCLCC